MKYLQICILYLLLGSFSLAENVSKKKPETIDEIKFAIANEKSAENIFYLRTNLLKLYLLQPIESKTRVELRSEANELIQESQKFKNDWNYGNAIHKANLVLGRLSLAENKVLEANEYLLKSARVKGSPQLDSFGPNMVLAKELLQKGQKEAVFKYFDLCLKFWKSQNALEDIKSWRSSIEKGEIPDFGANLRY